MTRRKEPKQSQNPRTKHTALCKTQHALVIAIHFGERWVVWKERSGGRDHHCKIWRAEAGRFAYVPKTILLSRTHFTLCPRTQAAYDDRLHALHKEEPVLKAVAASDSS